MRILHILDHSIPLHWLHFPHAQYIASAARYGLHTAHVTGLKRGR